MLVPVVDMKHTGQNIASLRVKRVISVREMQHMFGFTTPQPIYKWQRGETLPSLENLAVLACILDVAMDDILAVECRKAGS